MERRKRTRIPTHQAVYFVCKDAGGRPSLQDMGIVLNINQDGLLLESAHNLIGASEIRILASSDDQKPLEVKGNVVYSITVAADRYHAGIAFTDASETTAAFADALTGKSGRGEKRRGISD